MVISLLALTSPIRRLVSDLASISAFCLHWLPKAWNALTISVLPLFVKFAHRLTLYFTLDPMENKILKQFAMNIVVYSKGDVQVVKVLWQMMEGADERLRVEYVDLCARATGLLLGGGGRLERSGGGLAQSAKPTNVRNAG